jgi:tRNA 2-thiouridine synthesizing protein A
MDIGYDSEFDGGETSCGELLLDLRLHFADLPAGSKVRVRALDAGAPQEIPAWCRVVKHYLIKAEHPYYLIEKN